LKDVACEYTQVDEASAARLAWTFEVAVTPLQRSAAATSTAVERCSLISFMRFACVGKPFSHSAGSRSEPERNTVQHAARSMKSLAPAGMAMAGAALLTGN
jgi:hypothetical protein